MSELQAKIIAISLEILLGAAFGWAMGSLIWDVYKLFRKFRQYRNKKFQVGDFVIEKPDPKLGPLPKDQIHIIMKVTGIGKSHYRTVYCIVAGQKLLQEQTHQSDWPLWYLNDGFEKAFIATPLKAVKDSNGL